MIDHSGRFRADVAIEAMFTDFQLLVVGTDVAALLFPEPTASYQAATRRATEDPTRCG
jgi:hypothetical protein